MATLAKVWLERGKQEGRLEGRLEGKLEGREEGETLHARKSLRKLLVSRFGPLPDAVERRIKQADQATLDAWFDAALGAPSLESLFAAE
jgi:predicted transposase YdaD